MKSYLQRLLGHTHATVFDLSPQSVLALRVRKDGGCVWTVFEGVLTVNTATYDLSAFTVAQLAVRLAADGFDIPYVSAEISGYSALVLVEGSGNQDQSNGDHLQGFTSLLWALNTAYAGELRELDYQIGQALRQMVITQAEGEWLDVWGNLYGVNRPDAMSDASFQALIPKEAFRLRVNKFAIEDAILDRTGKVVTIEEPWQNVFTLDGSMLSGADKFQDGVRIGFNLIQPTSANPIDWTDVLPVIERNRAAGVTVLPPFARNVSHIDAGIVGTVDISLTSLHVTLEKYLDRTLLDFSNIEDIPVLNNPALHRQERLHPSGSTALTGWSDSRWTDLPWSDAPYTVGTYYYRSYRLYTSGIVYESQYWRDVVWADVAWSDYNVLIASSHTRS